LLPRTAGGVARESEYSTIWSEIDGTQFSGVVEPSTYQDNGAGISWAIASLGSGATATFDLDNVFQAIDPFGNGTGVTLGRGGVHLSSDFRTLTFVMHCGLPTTAQAPCDPFLAVLINIVNGTIHRGEGKGVLARQTGIASGQPSILPGQDGTVTLAVTKQGQKAFKKRAKKVKKLLKKAKKLKKAGNTKKAKKLRKKAKRLRKVKAHISVNNDRNGATASLTTKIKLP
jgi:hypothetical protein